MSEIISGQNSFPDTTATHMKVGDASTMEPPSSGGLPTEHTQLKGMFALIAYHIDFIPSIKVQQQ